MDSEMDRAHGLGHGQIHEQEHHHTVVEGDQDEHPYEKKSVMTRVKAKARKIKDSITKHGQDHDQEDDEDEEMVGDPDIHGAPKVLGDFGYLLGVCCESFTAAGRTAGQVGDSKTSAVNPGRSTAMDVDPFVQNVKPGSHIHGQEGQHRVTPGSTTVMGGVPHGPEKTHASHNAPGIHQTRDNDPSRKVDATPQMPVSLDPPGIHHSSDNVPHATPQMPVSFGPPGIHHSSDNVPSRTVAGDAPGIHHSRDNVPSSKVVGDRPGINSSRDNDPSRTFVHGEQDRRGQPKVNLKEDTAAPGAYTSSNYQTKVTDPTGKGGEAAGVTSVLHSLDKLKVHDDESKAKTRQEHNLATRNEDMLSSTVPTGTHDQFSPELTPPKSVTAGETFDSTKPKEHASHDDEVAVSPSSQSSYAEKISYATSAIAGKAFSAKNVMASKLGYGEKDNTTGGHVMHTPHEEGAGRPSSDQSSYTEKIPSATSASADKPISAKNVVASKLGYGQKDNTTGGHVMHPPHDEGAGRPSSDQSSYTEKIPSATSASADKPISAKNVVASKLGYGSEKDNTGGHAMHQHEGGDKNYVPSSAVGSTGTGTGTGTGTSPGTHTSNQQHGVGGQRKGGVSVKDYVTEKLRPGEEDRALSEVISETLQKRKPEDKRKPEEAARPVKEVVSDAFHKRNEEPDEEETRRPMGKVTESEEVARRLGTTKDDHDPGVGNKGMVDTIKGAVGSWFGKGDQSQVSQLGQGDQSQGSQLGKFPVVNPNSDSNEI
ncbi:hypothetical protein JRO89_XS11G0193200 [Xanthoceras sorbifolium]|uniref:Uncharacterized protein n=1 Tax=Xanthoceras sorbifolium TaxID=99658 RepID=A0ABQ8HG99_9ROSI|nr:hypothetical protein JRO89_XS11G0193200 [Xanthoceras sorbifolium]